jgi:hypothetical protein
MPQKGTKSTKQFTASTFAFCASLLLTAANKMHDLNPVVVMQRPIRPLTTTYHFAVEFDRNARDRQIELID